MKKEEKEVLIRVLSLLKKESQKRDRIRDFGVDLCNYQNEYLEACLMLVDHLSKGKKEEVEWWLFDRSSKKYILRGKEYPVENPEQLVDFWDLLEAI